MKYVAATLKIIVFSLIGIGLLSLFWAFVIPGLLLWWIFRDRYRPWMGALTALLITVALRLHSGHWSAYVGEQGARDWYVELPSGILSWVFGSFFVSAGYRIPGFFLDGLRKAGKPPVKLNP